VRTQRSTTLLVLTGALVLLGEGCGGSHRPAAHPAAARLVVTQTVDPAGGIPIEGAYSYLRVETRDGAKVVEERLRAKETTIRLDPGPYRLISFQRTCDANCGNLDPASDSCDRAFTMAPDKALNASLRVSYGSGCTIRFESA